LKLKGLVTIYQTDEKGRKIYIVREAENVVTIQFSKIVLAGFAKYVFKAKDINGIELGVTGEDFEAYDVGTQRIPGWRYYHWLGSGSGGTEEYGVSDLQAYDGTKSFRLHGNSKNPNYRGRRMYLAKHGLSPPPTSVRAYIYVATVASTAYGSTAGFIVRFLLKGGSQKAIYYRMAYARSDILPEYIDEDGNTYTPDVKIDVANATGQWLELSRDLISDFEANFGISWSEVEAIDFFCVVLANDGPSSGNSGEVDAYFDAIDLGQPPFAQLFDIRLGNDETTGASPTDYNLVGTDLGAPSRVNASFIDTADERSVLVSATWDPGTISGRVGEIGLFLTVKGKHMLGRVSSADDTFPAFDIDPTLSLTVNYKLLLP